MIFVIVLRFRFQGCIIKDLLLNVKLDMFDESCRLVAKHYIALVWEVKVMLYWLLEGQTIC